MTVRGMLEATFKGPAGLQVGRGGEERSSASKDSLLGNKKNGDEAGSRESVLTLGKMSSVLAIPCNLPTHTKGFPDSSAGKESACNVGDPHSIPGLRRSPGEGSSYPLQYSGLENSMYCIAHGVAKSQTRLSDFHFHFTSLHPHSGNEPLS